MTDLVTDKQFKELLFSVKKSIINLGKHDSIRAKHWIQKLQVPVNNTIWKQNRNFYLKIMHYMILQGQLLTPFNQVPPQGPLPKLTVYDVPYPIKNKITSENQSRKSNRKTPSCNKTQNHSRNNSISTNKTSIHKNSLNKQAQKIMQHRKKINFQGSGLFSSVNDQNINTSNVSFFQETVKAHTMKTDENFISQMQYLGSTQGNNRNIINYGSRRNSVKIQSRQTDTNMRNKGLNILKKSLKLLGEQYQNLSGQISYKQLIEGIVKVGQKYGQNMKQIKLDITSDKNLAIQNHSVLSQNYQGYTKRIKQNFTQSDNNYQQFMSYLNGLEK